MDKPSSSRRTSTLVDKFRISFGKKKAHSLQSEDTQSYTQSFTDSSAPPLSPLVSHHHHQQQQQEQPSPSISITPTELHPLWAGRTPSNNSLLGASSPMISLQQPPPSSHHQRSRSRTSSVLHRLSSAMGGTSRVSSPAPEEPERSERLKRLISLLDEVSPSKHLSFPEIESLLEENHFSVETSLGDFLDRAQLRQIDMGVTLRKVDASALNATNSWSNCDASVFKVRCGPRYREFKHKSSAQSQTLFDVLAVDMYMSQPSKCEVLSRYMKLSDLEKSSSSHPLPNVFVVNFMLPLVEPKMFGHTENGPTVHFHFVMKLSEWARNHPEHASVQLAHRFVQEKPGMRERLKIIVQVANPDDLSLGKVERGLCTKYNGLPFLYRQYNSRYHRGGGSPPGYFQADFDGHKSGYATRLARNSLMHYSDSIVANVGFLVEGELDEELPEVLLGCATVHRLQCRQAKEFVRPEPTFPLSCKEEEFSDAL